MKNYDELALRTEASINREQYERLAWSIRQMHAILGLTTEIGEFADVYKRFVYYGKPVDRVNAVEELGDILWYLAIAAKSLGSSIEECQRRNIAKLRTRYPEKFTETAALERDLEAERRDLEAKSGE